MSIKFILETAEDIYSQVTTQEEMFWSLVNHSVKDTVSIKRTDVSKILNGSRDVSKNLAAEILKAEHCDKAHFESYVENLIKEDDETYKRDALVESLPSNPYGVNTSSLRKENVAHYFTEMWFKYLKKCKEKVQHRKVRKPVAIDPLDIDERIRKVVRQFIYINENDTEFTDAKKVKEKVDKKQEFHLFKKIEGNVNDYFFDIQNLFIEEQESNDLIFEQVRRKIRNLYLSHKEKTPQEVFNSLVDWLMNETSTTDREACEAVMSFFVQNCEVFGK